MNKKRLKKVQIEVEGTEIQINGKEIKIQGNENQIEDVELNFSKVRRIFKEGHYCGRDTQVIKAINAEDLGITLERLAEKRGFNLKESIKFLRPFYA